MIDFITNGKLATLEKNLPAWRPGMSARHAQFAANIIPQWRMLGSRIDLTAKQRNTLTEIVERYR